MNTITLDLTNVYALGDYTASLYIGSEQQAVNLIIDTGSSTLVIKPERYQPENDQSLNATPIVQEVNYGIGGWAGAVIHSQLHFLDKTNNSSEDSKVADTSMAIVEAEPVAEKGSVFNHADGILGLAYHHLNKSFDLSDYFTNLNQAIITETTTTTSYPWPFIISNNIGDSIDNQESIDNKTPPNFVDLRSFKSFLWQYPEHDIKPLFTQIAEQHIVENRFSFFAKRSSVHVNQAGINPLTAKGEVLEQLKQDPLNQGKLILGGGAAQTELYQGEFQTIQVLHDIYYNVELISVQVGDKAPIKAAPLAQKDEHAYFTNAIIDTGASLTVLTHDIYQQVIKDLADITPKFAELITPFADINQQYQGIDASQLDLDQWPDITFTFTGTKGGEHDEAVSLACPPTHYWQMNTPEKDKACFKLLSQLPNWPNQTLIGLPLITNYYTVFDRSIGETGVIRFAKQR